MKTLDEFMDYHNRLVSFQPEQELSIWERLQSVKHHCELSTENSLILMAIAELKELNTNLNNIDVNLGGLMRK